MKRTLLILSLSISAAAATEEDFSKADPGTYSDVPYIRHEGHEDEALPAAYVRQRLEVLKGVQDTLSAKAAVSILRTLHPKSVSESETPTPPINVLQMGMAAELTRLRDAHFYGATALAEYLNYSAEDALVPQAPTPELLQKLQGEMLFNAANRPPQHEVSGGPGFARNSAWVVHVTDKTACYDAAFAAATDGLNSWEDSTQRMEVADSRRYIIYTLTLLRDGMKYKIEQWCDITAARRVYSPEEQQQAMQQIVANLRDMQVLMVSISDRESADTAAPQMAKLIRDISPLREIAETQNTENSLMSSLSPEFDFSAFREAIKRHREQDCYGSEALRAFLSSLIGS